MSSLFLGIYIALILIRPMDWWEPILDWQLVTVGALAVFFTGLQKFLGRIQSVWQTVPQMKAALWFFAGAVLSYLPSLWLGGMQMAFQDVGKVMFFFALIVILTATISDFKILLWSFLLCAAWLAFHAILQHHRGYGFNNQHPMFRIRNRETGEGVYQAIAFGTFEDPNDLCVVLVVAIPLFYVQSKIAINPTLKAFSVIGSALSAYGAWCTNSRGGVVAVFGMVGAYVLAKTKGFKRYITAAMGIACVTVLAPSRFSGGLMGQDRAVLWGDGLSMFKAHPLFGVGYNDFTSFSNEHLVAHNTYIHTLAELGLVGYLPLFLILYFTVVQLRRLMTFKTLLPPKDYLLLAGIYASLVGYFTGLYFISRQYQHILYVIISLPITAVYIISRQHGLLERLYPPQGKEFKRGLIWGVGSVVVMWITIRLANALS